MKTVDALAHALMLSITAGSDEDAHRALAIADQIATGLNHVEVARAKKIALALVDARDALAEARDGLDSAKESAKDAALAAIAAGATEVAVAQALNVNRLTIRNWQGK